MRTGVKEALDKGVILGYPLLNIKVELTDGSYHEVDSSELAFKLAASMAERGGEKSKPGRPRADHEGGHQRSP